VDSEHVWENRKKRRPLVVNRGEILALPKVNANSSGAAAPKNKDKKDNVANEKEKPGKKKNRGPHLERPRRSRK